MSRERQRSVDTKSHNKITVDLPDSDFAILLDLARKSSVTRTEALKRALRDRAFIADEIAEGKHIQIYDPATKESTRVIWTSDLPRGNVIDQGSKNEE